MDEQGRLKDIELDNIRHAARKYLSTSDQHIDVPDELRRYRHKQRLISLLPDASEEYYSSD